MKQVFLKLSTHQKDVPGGLPEIFLRRVRHQGVDPKEGPCTHRKANYWVDFAIGVRLVIVPVYAVPALS